MTWILLVHMTFGMPWVEIEEFPSLDACMAEAVKHHVKMTAWRVRSKIATDATQGAAAACVRAIS